MARVLTLWNDGCSISLISQPLRDSTLKTFMPGFSAVPTYRAVMDWLDGQPEHDHPRLALSRMYVHRNTYSSPDSGNAYLTEALQDLADQITFDVHEACQAFDDPQTWYPGVDSGIEPVSDEHVSRVIAGFQRELRRELRNANGSRNTADAAPSAPLDQLPWHVQRALVERRRFRFAQWGIGRQQWESNSFSLWDIPEDPDWLPAHIYNDY